MTQSSKPVANTESTFWLNPNVVAQMYSGFKACLSKPIEVREPAPEFALTEPGALLDLADVGIKASH